MKTILLILSLLVILSCETRQTSYSETRLDSQSNFRDLGGYKTEDQKRVKSGVIFRSGELPHINDKDLSTLDSLNIRLVVNFLTPEEIEKHGEDRLPDYTETNYIPIRVGNWAAEAHKAIKAADFSKLPPEISAQYHRLLIEEKTPEYARFIKSLIDADGKLVVFHCSHGVHRTGTASAIFLSLLNVPWETVREDYLKTNVYRKDEVEETLVKLRKMAAVKLGVPEDEVDMENINAFYILDGSYIDASRDAILDHYGSFENYAFEGLKLTKDDIEKLREIYLE
jgi:protein-tyrosine phosphatase